MRFWIPEKKKMLSRKFAFANWITFSWILRFSQMNIITILIQIFVLNTHLWWNGELIIDFTEFSCLNHYHIKLCCRNNDDHCILHEFLICLKLKIIFLCVLSRIVPEFIDIHFLFRENFNFIILIEKFFRTFRKRIITSYITYIVHLLCIHNLFAFELGMELGMTVKWWSGLGHLVSSLPFER